MKTLTPRTALITGATSGIGKVFASRLAEMGYDLILTGRRQELLAQVSDDLRNRFPVSVLTLCGDLSDPAHRCDLVTLVKKTSGIEVLVNNAGFGTDKPFQEMLPSEILSMVSTHDLAPLELIHAVVPHMVERGHGTIINVSSLAAFLPGLSETTYLATKSFLHQLSLGLNLELAGQGIYVQSLCPGFVTSDFHRFAGDGEVADKYRRAGFMAAEKVVDVSLRKASRGVMLCVPGWKNKIFYLITRMLPLGEFRLLLSVKSRLEHRTDPALA